MDAWKELQSYAQAAHDDKGQARREFPAWFGSLSVERLDELIAQGVSLKLLLGSLAAVRGWRGVVNDLRAALKARDDEKNKARLTLHQGGKTGGVLGMLALDRSGLPKVTMRNIVLILENDPRWVGHIKRNEFTGNVEIEGGEGMRPLADEHIRRMVVWLDEQYAIAPTSGLAHEGICHVADDHKYHPVRDYLNGLAWDKQRRVHLLFSRYAGAVDTSIVRSISERALISCVARVMEPGCKVDTVPVLHGEQGCRKSSFVRVLAGADWYRDTDIDPHGKDAYQQIAGVWLYEVPEIEKWNSRRDQSTIKGFLTSQTDSYRPPYGRCVVQQPRSCVFFGTTNEAEFLADPTGARRYLTVSVGKVDLELLQQDRDQLWAEAVALYLAGVQWHLDDGESALLVEAQQQYQESDPWEDHVAAWLDENPDARLEYGFALSDLLDGLKLEKSQQGRMSSKRARDILKRLGFSKGDRKVKMPNGSRRWRWRLLAFLD